MTDPERWLDGGDAPGNMTELLALARSEEPDAGAVERMGSDLRLATRAPYPVWLPRLGALLAAGGLIAFGVNRVLPDDVAPASEAPSSNPPSSVMPLSGTKAAGTVGEGTREGTSATAAPQATGAEVKDPAPSVPNTAAASNEAKPTELELIRGARGLLNQPARALGLLEQHRRLYPQGKLVEEREVLAIDALRRSSQAKAADLRLGRFLGSYPTSAHRPRLEREAQLASESGDPATTHSR